MPVTERRVVFAEAAERLQIQTDIITRGIMPMWRRWRTGRK